MLLDLIMSFFFRSIFLVYVILGLVRAETLEEAFEKAAAEIDGVFYGDFLVDRETGAPDPNSILAWDKLQEVVKKPSSLEEIEPLLEHENSKVRTLAILAAYRRNEIRAFELIFERMFDEGQAFPQENIIAQLQDRGRELKPLAVKEVVRMVFSVMDFHLQNWRDPIKSQQEFDDWSRTALSNAEWPGWYAFLNRKALGGMEGSTYNEARLPLTKALKEQIDALDSPLREWVYLEIDPVETRLLTEDEFVDVIQSLGGDALLKFIEDGTREGLRKSPVSRQNRGMWAALNRAKYVFGPEHSQQLFKLGYKLAAADASPERAEEYLKNIVDLDRSSSYKDQSLRAIAVLLDICGDEHAEYIADVFYAGPRKKSYSVFTDEVKKRSPKKWRKTFKALVAHPQFEGLENFPTIYLEVAMDQLSGGDFPLKATSKMTIYERRNNMRRYFDLPEVDYNIVNAPDKLIGRHEWRVKLPLDFKWPNKLIIDSSGKYLAAVCGDSHVFIIDASTGETLRKIEAGSIQASMSFGTKPGTLRTICDGIQRWDVKTGDQLPTLQHVPAIYGTHDMKLSSDESQFLYHSEKLRIRNLNDATELNRDFSLRLNDPMEFTPNGKNIVCYDFLKKELHLIDTGDLKTVRIMNGHAMDPSKVVFSSDGKWILSSSPEDRVIIWHSDTGEKKTEMLSSSGSIFGVGFCSGSKGVLCIHQAAHELMVVAVETGKPLLQIAGSNYHDAAGYGKNEVYTLSALPGESPEIAKWLLP